jgi:hypothetical protein
LLVFVPTALNHSAPLAASDGMLARVSTLLMIVGLPNRPLAFDAVDQGCLLPTDKSPRAHLDHHLEAEIAPEDVLAQEIVRLGLGDGRLEPLDRQGIFGPEVDVGLRGADAVGGDGHALDQPMGIALDHRTVHERARVALVGVADEVLVVAGRAAGELPLLPGGKAAAAPAPQSAGLDHVADLVGRQLLEGLGQGLVAAAGHVLFDLRGIDDSTVGQHPTLLRREEGMLVEIGHLRPGRQRVVAMLPQYPLVGDLAAEDGIQQGWHRLGRYPAERHPRLAGQLHVDDRLFRAEPDAADAHHVGLDLVMVQVFVNGVERLAGAGSQAAGSRPDEDHRLDDLVATDLGQTAIFRLSVANPAEQLGTGVGDGLLGRHRNVRFRLVTWLHRRPPFFGRSRESC